ncbi:carbamoyl phosphate synthase small subunit [Bacillus amyloliquefaciens]|uniref:carbamoyl phosphate synthase small subunit n=1 Tax=Bacillus amyloliquefaciens TaxID=1390 RepID=UPI0005F09B79|nr:carbamoyl phosphate synthase small subunit [Bacillus amyloliquefaciens]MDH3089584.1 carbamoyl phosphate synthase small subunit [Bacillus amyloliquefaciens]
MKGYLVLEDGTSFGGELEKEECCVGEAVFFTGMTGYQEVLTDPSYKGQIIVFTYPLIGNYGINEKNLESKIPQVKAVVVYEACEHFSHHEAVSSLREYLNKWNIPLLTEVDTRAVVKTIRSGGTMNAAVSTTVEVPAASGTENPAELAQAKDITSMGDGERHIALIDFGFKKSIASSLVKRGCKVTVIPYHQMNAVYDIQPDGIVLSNGPGDPKAIAPYMTRIKALLNAFPALGICLGHQLIALAFGGNTYKLPFGHRGANHPVIDRKTKRVFMTSQNHSYVVDESSIDENELSIRFHHVNDTSVEGLIHKRLPVLSVQFHPEAHPGPAESEWIFDEFLEKVIPARREIAHA